MRLGVVAALQVAGPTVPPVHSAELASLWDCNGFVDLDPESMRFVVRFVLQWGAAKRDSVKWITIVNRQLAAAMKSGQGKATVEFMLWALNAVADHLRVQGVRALMTPTAQEEDNRQLHWLYVTVACVVRLSRDTPCACRRLVMALVRELVCSRTCV